MGDIRTEQGYVLSTIRQSTPDMRTFQAQGLAAYNIPSESLESTQAAIQVAIRQDANIRVEQAYVLAAVRGRTADPTINAWTFTLDSHDYYVLRLGDFETIVLDLKTGQWYNWATKDINILPLTEGINWLGGNKLADEYGSNILCGDDSVGSIYLMSPETIYDDDLFDGPVGRRKFERVVQGQVPMRQYASVPCFSASVYGDIGQADESLTVKLETSDDSGFNYNDQGTITLTPGDRKTRLEWRSLGSITAPGRLFKITDDGALSRIDGLEIMSNGE